MDKLLKKIQSYSFSDKDMMRLVEGKANLVTYPEIKNYKSIDQLLGKHRACIILYVQKDKPEVYGHWCCIFERLDVPKLINFFDPYGFFPDAALNWNSDKKNDELGQEAPFLSLLIMKALDKYNFVYSNYKIQSLSKNNNICGRVVGLRLNFREFSNREFYELLTKNKAYTKDEWIVMLTSFIN